MAIGGATGAAGTARGTTGISNDGSSAESMRGMGWVLTSWLSSKSTVRGVGTGGDDDTALDGLAGPSFGVVSALRLDLPNQRPRPVTGGADSGSDDPGAGDAGSKVVVGEGTTGGCAGGLTTAGIDAYAVGGSATGGVGVSLAGGSVNGGVRVISCAGSTTGGGGVNLARGSATGGVGVAGAGGSVTGGVGVNFAAGWTTGGGGVNLAGGSTAGGVGACSAGGSTFVRGGLKTAGVGSNHGVFIGSWSDAPGERLPAERPLEAVRAGASSRGHERGAEDGGAFGGGENRRPGPSSAGNGAGAETGLAGVAGANRPPDCEGPPVSSASSAETPP